MNPWLVAVCLRCAIALWVKANTSQTLMHHVCWSHFTLWVSVITTTKWVTTWCSKEVNWFINIWLDESISPSRAIHKGCTSILFIFSQIDFFCLLPDRRCLGCIFCLFVGFCWPSSATDAANSRVVKTTGSFGTVSPMTPGVEAPLGKR